MQSFTTVMKIVAFVSYSVFDKLHYLKKPWRNLETFDCSLFETFGEQVVYFARKDKGK